MVTPMLKKALEKQGYRLIGSHSGVKLCRWTKVKLLWGNLCHATPIYPLHFRNSETFLNHRRMIACNQKKTQVGDFCYAEGEVQIKFTCLNQTALQSIKSGISLQCNLGPHMGPFLIKLSQYHANFPSIKSFFSIPNKYTSV